MERNFLISFFLFLTFWEILRFRFLNWKILFLCSYFLQRKRRSSPTSSNHSHEILSRSENQPLSRNRGHRSQHPGIQVSLTILELHLDAHSLPTPFPPLGPHPDQTQNSKPDPFPYTIESRPNVFEHRDEKSNETIQIQTRFIEEPVFSNSIRKIPCKKDKKSNEKRHRSQPPLPSSNQLTIMPKKKKKVHSSK